MCTLRSFLVLLIMCSASVSYSQDAETFGTARSRPFSVGAGMLSVEMHADPFTFDIVQNTCALYVAVRSGSLTAPVAFGEDLDEKMVRWNLCEWRETACRAEPVAPKDSAQVITQWTR